MLQYETSLYVYVDVFGHPCSYWALPIRMLTHFVQPYLEDDHDQVKATLYYTYLLTISSKLSIRYAAPTKR